MASSWPRFEVDGIVYTDEVEDWANVDTIHEANYPMDLPLSPGRSDSTPLTPLIFLVPGLVVEVYGYVDPRVRQLCWSAKNFIGNLINR